jgi:hypothetical protein
MNFYVGGDPAVDSYFTLLKNATNPPDAGNIWTFYTGVGDHMKTRSFKTLFGYPESKVV